jgi:hypothetical protein
MYDLNKKIAKKKNQHLTNGIRSGGDFAPPPGIHSPRSLCCHGSFHPKFVSPANASHSLIRANKPSYT